MCVLASSLCKLNGSKLLATQAVHNWSRNQYCVPVGPRKVYFGENVYIYTYGCVRVKHVLFNN